MSAKLRIALICEQRVPVERYGGTERIVEWMARGLLRRGHSVTLIAPAGSNIPGTRLVTAGAAAEAASRLPVDIDIVHAHGWTNAAFAKPTLWTLHGNAPGFGFEGNWNFISRDHASRHGRKTFVYNGIPPDEIYFQPEKSDRHLFLSRVNRAGKNVTRAIELSRRFDVGLDIAGGARWELLTRSVVRKEGAFRRSFSPKIRFHGMVGGWDKARLLAEARSLLFPIRWDEPFGLVAVEALLAGTPVIASPRGAIPEIVAPDVGFLCESDAEFAAAFEGVPSIDARFCRDYAATLFSADAMVAGYVELYRRILDGETLD
ncbi:glycosyltransferase [Kaistia algarum]|uniref:glycosyltransferase n=1 Tax=Kaistia algarum TaxID=2083279 RepID=UPI00225AD0AA|nr:glycosyltransferase [Kaistia algarum]MCX5514630.1 glycosyltransferase [Kaistia algarum]